MGFIQKDSLRTMLVSYFGLVLGYVNRGLLFIAFLTTAEIGLLNLIITVGLLFAQMANLGSIYTLIKFFPFFRNTEKKNHGFLPMILGIVCIGILIFTAVSFLLKDQIAALYMDKSPSFVYYYYWIIPVGIANVLFSVFDNYLRGLYKNVVSVIAYEVVLRIVIMLLIIVYGLGWITFDTFLVMHFLAYFIPIVILVQYMIRIGEFNISFRSIYIPARFRKIIISFSVYSYINTLGALLVMTLDAMMIADMKGLGATGVYTTVIFLTNALQVPFRALSRVSAPLIPLYFKERNLFKVAELYKKFSSVALVISLFTFLGVWVSRNEIFSLLPAEYSEGILVFLFLMIGKITDMYFGLNGNIFMASKKYKYDLLFTFALLIVVFLLNTVLIPKYGIAGAAISTTVSYLIYNAGRMLFVYVIYKIHPFQRKQFLTMAVFVVVIGLFELMPPISGNRFLEMGINSMLVGVLFIGSIYVFNLEPETVKYIRKVAGMLKRSK
jgi:O-antigen/teichoic acid export membrane protein